MCGDDGGRANATTKGHDASMLGIAQAKAIPCSTKAHGRSVLANADDDNNAMHSNEATNNNHASTPTMLHVMTILRGGAQLGRCQCNWGNNASATRAKTPA